MAVCLLIAGTANAAQEPAGSNPAPTDLNLPSVPPELRVLETPPASGAQAQPGPDGIAPDPAATSDGPPPQPVHLQPALPAESNCDTADCPAADGKAATSEQGAASVAKPKVAPAPVRIGVPAQRALVESHDWAENPLAVPTRDAIGRVIFAYGDSAPTIVCAPIHVTDIELQPGEVVQGAPHIGDSVRWRISPAVSGTDESRVTHLIIKPTESGLDTNLVVPTDRHTYHIRLVSSVTRYVASVGFFYPEEEQQAWSKIANTSSRGGGSNPAGDMPTVAVNRLNFNYKIDVVKGKPGFKPLRAMDDGYHTYIAMNEEMPQQDAPALIGISATGEEQMINYRLKGNIYVVDGTVHKLALVSGVGKHQERIELTRDPCKQRGWLGVCWDPKE